MRLLLVAFFLEVGLVLIIVPWSSWWDYNYFAQLFPQVHAIITNDFVRGAVSGLGIINVAAGVTELLAIIVARRAEVVPPSILPPPIAPPRHSHGIEPIREQE